MSSTRRLSKNTLGQGQGGRGRGSWARQEGRGHQSCPIDWEPWESTPRRLSVGPGNALRICASGAIGAQPKAAHAAGAAPAVVAHAPVDDRHANVAHDAVGVAPADQFGDTLLWVRMVVKVRTQQLAETVEAGGRAFRRLDLPTQWRRSNRAGHVGAASRT